MLSRAGMIPPKPIPSLALPMKDGGKRPRLPRKLVWTQLSCLVAHLMSHTDLEHRVDAAVEGVHEEHGDEEQLLHGVGVQADHGLDHEVARHHPHRAGQQPHPQSHLSIEVL